MSRIRPSRFLVAALLASTLLACASTKKQEGSGEYVDDSVVTTKVKAELLRDSEVSGFAVNVETYKGIVQLSGFVENAAERRRAVEIAQHVGGVKDVKDSIQIR